MTFNSKTYLNLNIPRIKSITFLSLSVPLVLSAFTHLWNPVGFPDIYIDEGVYLRRAMSVLQGFGPQEAASYYDHPYFGQLFLAGVFWAIGYPSSVNPGPDIHSIEMLYMVPRVLMGLLAVLDTFLVYKISEHRYNRKVAFIASILFAVMPITWLMRRIFLDSIMLPFLLSSILFAVYTNESNTTRKNMILVLLSGIFLGLSIFTKIPAFTMIPLVGYFLILNKYNRNVKTIGLWLTPLFLIPLIWPGHALYSGNFDEWTDGVLKQLSREDKTPIENVLSELLNLDPLLILLSVISILYVSLIKRDYLILLWIIPFLVFSGLVGRMAYGYWIMIIPAFCIVVADFVVSMFDRILIDRKEFQKIMPFAITSAISIFGLVCTILLITTNVTTSQFQATAFVVDKILDDESRSNHEKRNVTIISSSSYSWIFNKVFHTDYVFDNFRDSEPVKTKKIILMKDKFFDRIVEREDVSKKIKNRLYKILNSTIFSTTFMDKKGNADKYDLENYPYTNMRFNRAGIYIDVRSNY